MADEIQKYQEILTAIKQLPDWQEALRQGRKPVLLDDLLPGDVNQSRRDSIRSRGHYTETNAHGQEVKFGAVLQGDYVVATAAAISKNPGRSNDILRNGIDDYALEVTNRIDQIALYYRIYQNEGILNNAVNVASGLSSNEGRFYVRRAGKGKRPKNAVREELTEALTWWSQNVNSRPGDGPITGARGLTQIMEQGNRQAFIEGSYIGYSTDSDVPIPALGKTFKLPMFIQSLSTQYIYVPPQFIGNGLELFYWRPPGSQINALTSPPDKNMKPLIDNAFDSAFLNELKKSRQVLLQSNRVIHIKHRALETQAFGQSFIEPARADIVYKRMLQNLDYVTIDSLINRVVIVKVGSDNADSDYHNIETAQARLQALNSLYSNLTPNMHLLWAGPDIDVVDIGAHDKILDLDGRYDLAHERIIYALGIPKTLLNGEAAAGQVWAGYEGFREKLKAQQDNWAQALGQMANRIAFNNGFTDYDIVYIPNRALLADQSANSDLVLRARQSGLMSLRRAVSELGGDFEAERRNMLLEKGYDPDLDDGSLPPDEVIFSPPIGLPGDTRADGPYATPGAGTPGGGPPKPSTVGPDGNVSTPGAAPGRPPNSQRAPLKPERTPTKGKPKTRSNN